MKHICGLANETIKSFPLAIIVSQFNRAITNELLTGTLNRLQEQKFASHEILIVEVPGAIEIPLVAKRLAKKNCYQAIITLGAVIRGETTHYDYVCQQVSEGCQRVALEFEVPVIFGVLTTENDEQAWDRLGGRHGHKGHDAADCALAMADIMKQLAD